MSEEAMPNIPERRSGWQFDRTINLPIILSMLILAGGGFNYINNSLSDLDKRLIVLESAESARKEQNTLQMSHQAARDAEQRQQMNYLVQRVDALKDAIVKKN